MGYYVLLSVLGAFALKYSHFELSRGTKRIEDDNDLTRRDIALKVCVHC